MWGEGRRKGQNDIIEFGLVEKKVSLMDSLGETCFFEGGGGGRGLKMTEDLLEVRTVSIYSYLKILFLLF